MFDYIYSVVWSRGVELYNSDVYTTSIPLEIRSNDNLYNYFFHYYNIILVISTVFCVQTMRVCRFSSPSLISIGITACYSYICVHYTIKNTLSQSIFRDVKCFREFIAMISFFHTCAFTLCKWDHRDTVWFGRILLSKRTDGGDDC